MNTTVEATINLSILSNDELSRLFLLYHNQDETELAKPFLVELANRLPDEELENDDK
jgi:hypothetical protein